jgi:two-component system, NarL family, sensor kinase
MQPLHKQVLVLAILLIARSTMLVAQPDFYEKQFEHERDSALDELKKHPYPDTTRAMALINVLDCAPFLSQKKQLLPYYFETIALSRRLKFKKAEAVCLVWMGGLYKSQHKTDSAILYFDSALLVADTAADAWTRHTRAFAHFQKGLIYETGSNYYKALDSYFDALKTYNSDDLDKQQAVLIRLATIYERLYNDEKALQYYQEALTMIQKLKGKRTDVESESLYTSIANIYFKQGEIAKAKEYLYRMAASMPDTTETLTSGAFYHLAGQIALKQHRYDSAGFYLRNALLFFEYTRHMDVISNINTDLARLKLTTGDLLEAKKYALRSIDAAKQSGEKDVLASAMTVMAEYYNKTGAQSKAYEALSQANLLSDSVLVAANIKQANTLSAIYENDQKEKQIAELELDKKIQTTAVRQKALLNIVFGIALVMLLIISFGIYVNFKKNQKIERQRIAELEKEKQLMGVEAMLKGQEEERHRLARDLHDGLGSMLSGVKISFSTLRDNIPMTAANAEAYGKTLEQLDRTIAELRKVAHNLMPEALVRFGLKSAVKDFCESLRLAGNTEIICEQFGEERDLGNIADVNIYRIVQELINNAIHHGKARRVLVQITKTADKIMITVEDDGKGFELDNLKKATGIGWSNIQSRVNYFNGVIDIDSKLREGTTINIELTA